MASMTSEDLSREQAEKVHDQVFHQIQYINRLIARMKARRFPPNDQMMVAAERAHDGLVRLANAAHSASVKMGLGRR